MSTWPAVLPRRAVARPAPRPLPARLAGLPRRAVAERHSIYAALGEGASWRSTSSWLSALSAYSALSFLSVGSFSSAFALGSIGSSGSLFSIGSTGSILSIGSAGSILSIGSTGSILSIGSNSKIGANAHDDDETPAADVSATRLVERGATILGTCALVAGAIAR